MDIELFDEIEREGSKWNQKGRNILLNIKKKDCDKEHWPRLIKNKEKNGMIGIDWSKFVDEEEEEEDEKAIGAAWDPALMNSFEDA